jgi:hydroxyacylglutathione hydrolase
MALMIEQFPCRSDNFGVLIHNPDSDVTAAIDAPELGPIKAALDKHRWRLDTILATHHHADHTEANLALKAEFGCTIIGPAGEAAKIPGIDRAVSEGDRLDFGTSQIEVIETPGHTLGHITYWMPAETVAFVGDTLFAVGCGRVIEGTYEMMWDSLAKLLRLPDDTDIYCGHEYTEANIRFALTVDPDNPDLRSRERIVRDRRAAGKATLPTTMLLEKQTNPFLRVDDQEIRAKLRMPRATAAEVFAELRKRKDNFKG